jgi:hypothetical protein
MQAPDHSNGRTGETGHSFTDSSREIGLKYAVSGWQPLAWGPTEW